ncbi:MAG TPA: hypothetical protein DCR43_08040 [Bacteroidales bacterium]|nr:MAG: hypothetical protein A2X11_15170 [Bacteroidetes bacterium GWE2_42_24]OFY31683.1 MAG: hypothetical protein A2X09_08915 [Bacteroidetes bacterium GWF2_43_11]HAQ65784.1 hypothetical protein [Bacteroidales bacterium]HBZ67051.1 hypothetical protein [Bacteroidales bacterium]
MNSPCITFNDSTIEAVIFDMDGTIVPNRDYHMLAWRRLCDEEGIKATNDELLATFGSTNREIFGKMMNRKINEKELDRLAARKESLYRESYLGHVKATKGLPAFLDSLRQLGIPLALATSAPTENVEFTLAESHLKPYFQIVIDASGISKSKPDPEIFQKTALHLNIHPNRCLVFEDAPMGIQAALSAGMKVLALTTTFSPDQLPSGVPQVEDFSSLRLQNSELIIK